MAEELKNQEQTQKQADATSVKRPMWQVVMIWMIAVLICVDCFLTHSYVTEMAAQARFMGFYFDSSDFWVRWIFGAAIEGFVMYWLLRRKSPYKKPGWFLKLVQHGLSLQCGGLVCNMLFGSLLDILTPGAFLPWWL